MYDARGPSGTSNNNSNLIFAGVTFLVIGIAFFGVLFFPNASDKSIALATNSESVEHPILAELADNRTRTYIQKLSAVAPKSAEKLSRSTEQAIAQGAGKNELVMLMLSTYDEGEGRILAKADVRYFDAMSAHLSKGLRQLSQSNSKWCRASHYESMSNVDPALVISDLGRALGYGSDFYNWTLDFSIITLDAIEDARRNPKTYSGLTPSDEAVLQRAAMGLIADPQIMQLMMLQSSSPADAKRAVANVNLCDLGLSVEKVFRGLPKGTRERMWGEMAKEIRSGGMGRSLPDFTRF